ncbi:13193_t:CDS:2, partial [Gigaspora margarita]
GAIAKFQAQNLLQATKTKYWVQYQNSQFARNAAISGACLLLFGNSTICFDHLLELSFKEESIMYKQNYFRSIQTDHLLLEKKKHFNKNKEINLLDNDLERLCYWLSNIEIDDTINIGYERAIYLARHLKINSIPNNAYYFNIHKKFFISQLEDFWNENLNLETANNNKYNTDSGLSVSY